MSNIESIIGVFKLNSNIKGMPEGGITVSKIRVELFEESSPNLAWIAELKILSKLPLYEGSVCKVEVIILTNEFKDYVLKNVPQLLVRKGVQIIGSLETKKTKKT